MPDIFDLIDLGQKADVETGRQRDESASLAARPKNKVDIDIFDQVARTPQGGRSEAMLRNPPTSSTGEVMSKVGEFAKKSALPTAGGLIGGAAGTLAGPGWGNVIGAGLGGAAGEALNQYFGITEPSATDIAISAVAPVGFRGAAQAAKSAKPLLKAVPGVSDVLKQPVVQQMKELPAKFLPAQSSRELYAELASQPEAMVKFPKTIAMMENMAQREERLIPGLQSEAIKRGERGGAEKLTTARPETIDPVRQAQGYTG